MPRVDKGKFNGIIKNGQNMRYSEEELKRWTNPPSETEDEKLQNAERMVKDAINSDEKLCSMNITIFCQGSYANNTNIRLDSDIDVNVCYTDAFYYDLPEGYGKDYFGLGNSCHYSFSEYKNDVEKNLVAKFGRQNVMRKNKCITVKENTYRAEIDVVPTWKHRWYHNNKSYSDGVVLFSDNDFSKIINYPLQHIKNGKEKNENTLRRFKSLVRIFKKINVKMEEDGYYNDQNITSFLLESVVWNCPNSVFVNYNTWQERLKEAIIYIYNNTTEDATKWKEWGEVSDLLYLFHSQRKWSRDTVNRHVIQMWNYMGY